MTSETTTKFPAGTRVRVAADADDVWFDGEVEGVVIETGDDLATRYERERRVHVREANGRLTQYVRPEDLTILTDD